MDTEADYGWGDFDDEFTDFDPGEFDVDPDAIEEDEDHALDTNSKLCGSEHPTFDFTCRRIPGHNGRCGGTVGGALIEWMPS